MEEEKAVDLNPHAQQEPEPLEEWEHVDYQDEIRRQKMWGRIWMAIALVSMLFNTGLLHLYLRDRADSNLLDRNRGQAAVAGRPENAPPSSRAAVFALKDDMDSIEQRVSQRISGIETKLKNLEARVAAGQGTAKDFAALTAKVSRLTKAIDTRGVERPPDRVRTGRR